MRRKPSWSLGAKLAVVGTPFLLLALVSIAFTLWVSWQLDGGAGAVNEAGRMRMQAYRLALAVGAGDRDPVPSLVAELERSLKVLHDGDAERPLFVPWDDEVKARFGVVEREWRSFRDHFILDPATPPKDLQEGTSNFTGHIDALVAAIETHLSVWTALLHLFQTAMMVFAVVGGAVLLYTGYRFVLEPVGQLKSAIGQMQAGDFSVRVVASTRDEFGTLADGFNSMAEHLQSIYRNLETKVREKTAELEEKRERLECLYEVTALVAQATTLDELAQGFCHSVARIARADGVALRWSDESQQRYMLLASIGLTPEMLQAEQCLQAGDCHCAPFGAHQGLRVIPIHGVQGTHLPHCAKAGYETVVNIPVRLHERVMGEVDLLYHAQLQPTPAERSLLEALTRHLAGGMENLRLNAMEKEAAVAQERHLIARELHDSIAQSLAFLKIQVQLMRDAVAGGDPAKMGHVLEEIDTGVRESYGDVRELLLHFRTRTDRENIEPALTTTLLKFEQQSGVRAVLHMQGHGIALAPDVQIQVLHVLQEALSNVRKHARATQVWLDVEPQPQWRFQVRDNGCGFDTDGAPFDETHVGLHIMRERAERIGAQIDVVSRAGHGTTVSLVLPPVHPASHSPTLPTPTELDTSTGAAGDAPPGATIPSPHRPFATASA